MKKIVLAFTAAVIMASCVFASVHLDFKDSKLEQAKIVNDWFTEHYSGFDKPVFLCGDMNATPGSPAIRELEKYWTKLSPDAATFPGNGKCIDYIFALKSAGPVEVISAGVISDRTSDYSDHYPVVVKVRK